MTSAPAEPIDVEEDAERVAIITRERAASDRLELHSPELKGAPGNPARLVGLLGGVVENDGGEQHVVWIEARDLQCADAAAMCAGFSSSKPICAM